MFGTPRMAARSDEMVMDYVVIFGFGFSFNWTIVSM